MKLLFVTSEAVPLAKTGGLADVAGSLPKALKERGVDAGVIMPKYGSIPESVAAQMEPLATFTVWVGWRRQYCGLLKTEIEGVSYYLIDNEYYFRRGGLYGYEDDAERFVFFSLAVIEALHFMEKPEVIHCHDWQSALVPYLLRTKYGHVAELASIATVFTIHNLKYQGVLGTQQLMDLVGMGEEMFGHRGLEYHGAANIMKGALEYADKLTTVSPTYAREIQTAEYGEGLDGLLRHRAADLSGIVNGIDTSSFDPMNDPALVTPYRNSLAKKRRNKLALQRELGLPESESTPLIGIVSRLVDQKGLDLIAAVLWQLLDEDVQLVVLGSGDPHYEGIFRHATESRPDKIKVWFGFNDSLARRIYAGSDMYLMPSLFEPCGLSQLLALRYRSVPIVRETGGLIDTVKSYEEETGEGNGFSFAWYNAHDMLYTIRRAIGLYRDEKTWEQIVSNGVKEDYSWTKSAKAYTAIYQELAARRNAAELSGV
ncbi:glycogen synthase GlgA [Paenibacillus aurantiacus]|uniref:Glycogen synthase n=1 Tax=Paenibacillus aurantiacus TaxID=1936118 RepID=A0ABV5L2W2_9BACL